MSSDLSSSVLRAIREQAEQLQAALWQMGVAPDLDKIEAALAKVWRLGRAEGAEEIERLKSIIMEYASGRTLQALRAEVERLKAAEGAAEPPAPLLAIASLVNGYHNDGTTLSAAETLRAIADVLGKPMQRPSAPAEPGSGDESPEEIQRLWAACLIDKCPYCGEVVGLNRAKRLRAPAEPEKP